MIQIITGIVLAMHYTPSVEGAFASIEHIMRDVNYGWLIKIYSYEWGPFFLYCSIHPYIWDCITDLINLPERFCGG